MSSSDIATIVFRDALQDDEATIVIRRVPNATALALSLRSNGDMEVFVDDVSLRAVIEALQTSLNK
jgi:hypothetical protein